MIRFYARVQTVNWAESCCSVNLGNGSVTECQIANIAYIRSNMNVCIMLRCFPLTYLCTFKVLDTYIEINVSLVVRNRTAATTEKI